MSYESPNTTPYQYRMPIDIKEEMEQRKLIKAKIITALLREYLDLHPYGI